MVGSTSKLKKVVGGLISSQPGRSAWRGMSFYKCRGKSGEGYEGDGKEEGITVSFILFPFFHHSALSKHVTGSSMIVYWILEYAASMCDIRYQVL